MNREGRRHKAVGSGTCAVWAVVLALRATTAGAQTPSPGRSAYPPVAGSAEHRLKITLRVYNYAHVVTAQLSRAEEEATAILRQAGVRAAWVDCPLSAAELENFPGCHELMGASDFALRLRSSAMTPKAAAHEDALGSAKPCPREGTDCSAEVFCQRVAEWARDADISAYQLLGHAMAHEIGHLLLGPNSHSRAGIMLPQWNPNDLKDMAQTSLRFTPEQTARIRAAVLARTQQPKVTQLQTR